MKIVSQVSIKSWNAFLDEFPSTIYHTPEWKSFLEKTFGYVPVYCFALGSSGEVTGLLPLFKVKGIFSEDRLCAVPFGHACGPLGTLNVKNLLIRHAIDIAKHYDIGSIEIRESTGCPDFKEINSFSTFVLNLERDPEKVWRRLDKGSVRWAVKKAENKGITVEQTHETDGLRAFFELNCLTKRDLGVPCHPLIFFRTLFDIFGDKVQLYLAKQGRDVVGGGIFLYYGDQVLYGYGAADPKHLNVFPYNAFIWEAIKDACKNEYSFFDFGRTFNEDSGLLRFKKHWGTVEKKLIYSFFPPKKANGKIDRTSASLSVVRKLVNRLPLSLYKEISKKTFTFIG